MLLLSKYYPVIYEHFNVIIKKASKKKEKNQKGRGNFLTFLSKNMVQLVINAISFNIKNIIISEV